MKHRGLAAATAVGGATYGRDGTGLAAVEAHHVARAEQRQLGPLSTGDVIVAVESRLFERLEVIWASDYS